MRDTCADCGQIGPTWASVNRGILLCNDCCSVHRNLGRHISIIKSINNDLWSPSLLLMFETLCKAGANNIWEHTLLDHNHTSLVHKPNPNDVIHPTKEDFIRAKHENFEFVLRTDQEVDGLQGIGAQLHAAARTPDLLTSLRLFAQGADPNFYHEEKGGTPLHVAAKCNQLLQAELLIVNGADLDSKNSSGQTPEECAREVGHLALADRLSECRYHVIDRLARFLCSRKPGIVHQQYEYLPEFLNSLDQLESNSEADSKLQMLPNRLFEKLVADLYDEVDRRDAENVYISSLLTASSAGRPFMPFLPAHPDLSSTRNQGRQKLGRFSNTELCALIYDVLRDAKRRETVSQGLRQSNFDATPRPVQHSQLLSNRLKSEISDEEPLYDSVASDEDYASAEKIAEMRRAMETSKPEETVNKAQEAELRQGLALSQATISQLQLEVKQLQTTIEGLVRENRELREEVMRGKSTSSTNCDLDNDTNIEVRTSSRTTRPTSMYETREGLRMKIDENRIGTQSMYHRPLGSSYSSPEQPSSEEVIRRTDQVTKRIKELWTAMKESDHRSIFLCATPIGLAVGELASLFPQNPHDDLIRELIINSARLRMECKKLQDSLDKTECLQQIRNCAFSIAKATKLLVVKFGNQ